jgi:hypothetical protein
MQLGTRTAITRRRASHRPIYFFSKPQNIEIVVSISPQSVHRGPMGRDMTARVIDASLWGLAFLILGGTILAYLVW